VETYLNIFSFSQIIAVGIESGLLPIVIRQVYVVPDKAVVRQRGLELVKEILLPGINAVSPVPQSRIWNYDGHMKSGNRVPLVTSSPFFNLNLPMCALQLLNYCGIPGHLVEYSWK